MGQLDLFNTYWRKSPPKSFPTACPETKTEPVILQESPTSAKTAERGVSNRSPVTTRSLKIEAHGISLKSIKPKIRLIGHWLKKAGFDPGGRVHVKYIAPGVLELMAVDSGEDSADQLE